MNSLILSTATRLLMPLLVLFSFFLLIRGHNEPGGGFVGGLTAAAAFALYAIAFGVQHARERLRIDPKMLTATGLATAMVSGLPALLTGRPYLTGLWLDVPIPVVGKVGTPLLFDLGVYLLVIGIVSTIVFSLAEEE